MVYDDKTILRKARSGYYNLYFDQIEDGGRCQDWKWLNQSDIAPLSPRPPRGLRFIMRRYMTVSDISPSPGMKNAKFARDFIPRSRLSRPSFKPEQQIENLRNASGVPMIGYVLTKEAESAPSGVLQNGQ